MILRDIQKVESRELFDWILDKWKQQLKLQNFGYRGNREKGW